MIPKETNYNLYYDKVREDVNGRHEALKTNGSEVKLKSRRLPLETKNTQKNENRRLGFIKSLHIQWCYLRGCIGLLAPVFDFQSKQNGFNDPKGNKI